MATNSSGDSKTTLYCSFCGKSQHEVRKLIAGPTVFICDECVELCMDIIREETKSNGLKSTDGVPTPTEMCGVLDDYVIGQAKAKRVLSVAVHNHYKRLNHAQKSGEIPPDAWTPPCRVAVDCHPARDRRRPSGSWSIPPR